MPRAKANDTEMELVAPGLHKARCIRVIDRGTHLNERYGKFQHQLMIVFELPETKIEQEGEFKDMPFTMCVFPNLTIGENSQLRPLLIGWLGRSFTPAEEEEGYEVFDLIDKTAYINVVHNQEGSKTYANVASISPLSENDCPPRVNDLVKFDLDNFDQKVFEDLSEKMQTYIEGSREWEFRFDGKKSGEITQATHEAHKQKFDFKAEFETLPKKTFTTVMELCKKTMGESDFASWFTDNGYPSVDKITHPERQAIIAKALKAICEKREFVVQNFGSQDIAEEEIPF